MRTTVGQLLINDGLPDDLRDYGRQLDKKSIKKLMSEVAQKHPDQYTKVLRHLMDTARAFASNEGASVSLQHLRAGEKRNKIIEELQRENQADIDNDELTDEQRDKRIVVRTSKAYEKIREAVMSEGLASGSPYAVQAKSGSRGNPQQLSSLVGADLLVSDHRNEVIPVPIYNSYSHGLDPVEYWAAAYGTRKGLVDTKFSVADAGFLSKQLALAAQRMVVTDERPVAARVPVGLPTDLSDPDNEGAVLAADVEGYKAGTVLSARVIEDLRRKGRSRVLIHSPLTSITENGGIDQWSAGFREKGRLADIGDAVGLVSSQAVGEPISQGLLNCLAKGTLVRMADFSVKPIEEIRVGDVVLGADKAANTFPVKVTHFFDHGTQPCQEFVFRQARSHNTKHSLVCTVEHKVLTHRYYSSVYGETHRLEVLPIGKMSKASGICCGNGLSSEWWRLSDRVDRGSLPVFDIEVDHQDHLFVLANGMIVSNSKHTAGVGGSKVSRGGFQYINNLLQGPETFVEAGPLAPVDGVVTNVEPAPQGGHYIHFGEQKVYVRPELQVQVKPGQRVDTGDDLTDGVPHPRELVKYRGLGEARRVYTNALVEALRNSDLPIHRRNAEVLVAGILNHAKITSPDGYNDHLVDQVVPYNTVLGNYRARENAQRLAPKKAVGRYLEERALHYTPGTRITQRVAKDLEEFGVQDVDTHDDPPAFEPHFERLMTSTSYDPDWQTRLGGFYIGRSLLKSVHEGLESDPQSTSFIPAVAQGATLGKKLTTEGHY